MRHDTAAGPARPATPDTEISPPLDRRHRDGLDTNLHGEEARRSRLRHEINFFGLERRTGAVWARYGLVIGLVAIYVLYRMWQ